MIEFFLSKVWAFIFGVAVVALILNIFHSMNSGAHSRYAMRSLDELSDTIDEIGDREHHCRVEIPLEDILPRGSSLTVLGDVLRLEVEGEDYYREIPEVVLIERGAGTESEVQSLRCQQGDTLVVSLQKEAITIHCLCSSISSSIESTIRSQSCRVLYT